MPAETGATSLTATARVTDPNRWAAVAEIDNMRDLGGLPVAGGGRTRRGVVYRTSTVQQASDADVAEVVGRLGVKTLLDLRLPAEVEREGHGAFADSDLDVVGLPIRKNVGTTLDVVVPDSRKTDLSVLYQQLLLGSIDSLVAAAELIGDADRHGVMFQCAAGKDRTGVLAAVLLDAVGVPADEIVADYGLSAERVAQVRARLVRIPAYSALPALDEGAMGVDEGAIRSMLDMLHTEYGGAAAFLREHGLSADALDRLREALVEPDTAI